ncbi:hypothetical protein E2C01_019055 [Portunus trituberculatus]|uniref:Uncharacterized protein n=1 Tax=Portunus trituberculatus TaxID=210409 RepID=A0A5B7DW81_PORTR|nr:hypothetical protein [Portunus trituberculatus]
MGYWKREPLRSLGDGEIEQLEAGDVMPPTPPTPLLATRVGMTTLVGVLGVTARDDPKEVMDAVLEEYADQPPAGALLDPYSRRRRRKPCWGGGAFFIHSGTSSRCRERRTRSSASDSCLSDPFISSFSGGCKTQGVSKRRREKVNMESTNTKLATFPQKSGVADNSHYLTQQQKDACRLRGRKCLFHHLTFKIARQMTELPTIDIVLYSCRCCFPSRRCTNSLKVISSHAPVTLSHALPTSKYTSPKILDASSSANSTTPLLNDSSAPSSPSSSITDISRKGFGLSSVSCSPPNTASL